MTKYLKIFLIIQFSVFAQDNIENLMKDRVLDCGDIWFNSVTLIPKFYNQQKIDSVKLILNYWNSNCGNNYFIFQTNLLLELRDGTFDESNYTNNLLFNIYYFKRNLLDTQNVLGHNSEREGRMHSAASMYESFLRQSYIDIKTDNSLNLRNLLIKHYSGQVDSTFIQLKQNQHFTNTNLYKNYIEYQNDIMYEPYGYFSIITGMWFPASSRLNAFGNRLEFGIEIGGSDGSWSGGFNLLARLGNTRNPYTYSYEGIEYLSESSVGAGLGFDIKRSITRSFTQDVSLLAGLTLETYAPDLADVIHIEKKGITSWHLSFGLEYRVMMSKLSSQQVSVQLRYNKFFGDTSTLENAPVGDSMNLRLSYNFLIRRGLDEVIKLFDF